MSIGLWALALFLGIVPAGCAGDPPIEREWTPADHGQPRNADPERTPREAEADDEPESPEATRARAARALWNVSCAGCHGRTGRGDGMEKPPGAQLPDLSDPAWQASRSDEELAQSIRDGKNLMPAFAERINPEGVRALVGHVRTLAAEPGAN